MEDRRSGLRDTYFIKGTLLPCKVMVEGFKTFKSLSGTLAKKIIPVVPNFVLVITNYTTGNPSFLAVSLKIFYVGN